MLPHYILHSHQGQFLISKFVANTVLGFKFAMFWLELAQFWKLSGMHKNMRVKIRQIKLTPCLLSLHQDSGPYCWALVAVFRVWLRRRSRTRECPRFSYGTKNRGILRTCNLRNPVFWRSKAGFSYHTVHRSIKYVFSSMHESCYFNVYSTT